MRDQDSMIESRKKRMLYADPLSYSHHKEWQEANIKILQNLCEISLFALRGYFNYKSFNIDKVFEETNKKHFRDYIPHNSRIGYFFRAYLGQFINITKALKIGKREKYDLIYFTTVDIIPFFFATFFSKQNIFFVVHTQYVTMDHPWMKIFWKHLRRNINIVVFEPFFKETLEKDFNCNNKIFCVKHTLRDFGEKESSVNKRENSGRVLVFAPASSNDPQFAEELSDYSIPEEVDIVIKGNRNITRDNYIEYSGQLSDDEYIDYFNKCDYVLIPFPKNYADRISGVLFDAMSAGKKVLLLKGNFLEYYGNNYNKAIYMFDNIDDLLSALRKKGKKLLSDCKLDMARFQNDYSDTQIEQMYKNILDNSDGCDE